MLRPTALPWRRPRHERLLLALVAAAALTPVHALNQQDTSRLCLTEALEHGHVSVGNCVYGAYGTGDRARFDGRWYTDKAPGLSALELPAAEAVQLPAPPGWHFDDLRLWAVRVFSVGIAFLVSAFLVGRVAEGIEPGWGGATLVTFALGTLMSPFAAANFDHVPAAALSFAAFALAWRGRAALAGLVAGIAVVFEYQTALVGVLLAAYLALRGLRPLIRYAAGAVPGLVLLGAYDWAAFGSPFHLSYRYITNQVFADQAHGFFGIGVPNLHAVHEVFVGDRGLFVASPIVLAAAAGLVLLARRMPAEAALCAAVTVCFLLVNCGYYTPYGGLSPGPRFLVSCLPFLALGIAPAFARWTRVTAVLGALSVVATTATLLVWANGVYYNNTIWGELARVPLGGSRFVQALATNVIVGGGSQTELAAVFVFACALGSLGVALTRR